MDDEIYYKAMRIRMVEEEISRRYSEKKMRQPVHLSIGQELNAVLLCEYLKPEDQMVSTHRGHAHYLAKGGDLNALIAELHGKATGCSGGLGGSMHLCAPDVGFMGSTSIVGGTIPVGVGLAFANKLNGNDNLVVVCIGDAAIEEGVFWESYNFAMLHKLKVLFFCEDNEFSCYTHLSERQAQLPIFNSYEDIFEPPCSDYNKLLRQMLPMLVRLQSHRRVEHCGPNNDDHLGYKSQEYMDEPDQLLDFKYDQSRLDEFQKEIDTAFKFAEESPFPKETVLFK